MKHIFRILAFLFLTSNVYGQIDGIESLMTRKYLSCQDIRYNAQFLIPEFYKKDSKDTLNAIIDYWEKYCGLSEEIIRCRILFAIDNREFDENTYDSTILNYLISYKNSTWGLRNKYRETYIYYNWYSNTSQPDTLKSFTVNLAKVILARNDLKPIERFFLKMYSNDFEGTFAMLQSDDFKETKIHKYYFSEIQRNNRQIILHGDFILGVWIPQDNLEILGNHPFIGLRGGYKYKRLIVDATIGFKFVKSPNVYKVYKNDSIWDTDHFFGGYIGIDLGLEMFRIKNNSFDLIGGVAFDGFDAIKVDDPNSNTDISKSISSLNLNIGLGYKYNINKWNYIGVDFKYNIVDFKNNMGTDLSGNAFMINLIYGFFEKRYNVYRLEGLDYKE
ncbi:MAG: hypothetical protein ACOYLE_08065 [Bacteroidales bacterium]